MTAMPSFHPNGGGDVARAQLTMLGARFVLAAGSAVASPAPEVRFQGGFWLALRFAAAGGLDGVADRLALGPIDRFRDGIGALLAGAGGCHVGVLLADTAFVARFLHIGADQAAPPSLVHAEPDDLECVLGRTLLGLTRDEDHRPGSLLVAERAAGLLAAYAFRRHGDLSARLAATAVEPGGGLAGLADWRLRRCLDYLHDNLGRDIGLDELASAAGLSPVYFARQFKRAMGLAPHQYLIRRRVERAKGLLATTELPIAQVALDCGFGGQEHFTTVFRKVMVTTSAAYRRALRA